jgi:2-C-methyl-D-erythritol 2,4-cyclodiphosphate synthase
MNIRVGQGFDVHKHVEGASDRILILGGVKFPDERPLAGHAAADALLGAAGLGDIGEHFSDTDPRWKGADSLKMLEEAAAMVRRAGYMIGNVDCSVICEAPKIAPHKATMQENLSKAVGAPVTVKGRRAEELGAIGRREGIACFAVTVIERS